VILKVDQIPIESALFRLKWAEVRHISGFRPHWPVRRRAAVRAQWHSREYCNTSVTQTYHGLHVLTLEHTHSVTAIAFSSARGGRGSGSDREK
jgi:hypothetical protein